MKKTLILSFAIILSACRSGAVPAANGYVGLSVEKAEERAVSEGVPFRVVMKDGEGLPVTMDFRPGRINAVVENDIVTSYQTEGEEEAPMQTYDQNSWETMIADSCMSYFDGCNNCRRNADNEFAACTKKFCQEYEEPRCLDAE